MKRQRRRWSLCLRSDNFKVVDHLALKKKKTQLSVCCLSLNKYRNRQLKLKARKS